MHEYKGVPEREKQDTQGELIKPILSQDFFDPIEQYANQIRPFTFIPVEPKYNHDISQVDFESPEMDAGLHDIREARKVPGRQPTFNDLFKLVQSESRDIKKQQKEYESTHPEWMRQKALIAEATEMFIRDEERKKVDILVDPKEHNGANVLVFRRDKTYEYPRHISVFENTLAKNDMVERQLLELDINREDVPEESDYVPPESGYVELYIEHHRQRWAHRREQANTDEERALAEANEDFFTYLTNNRHETIQAWKKQAEEWGDVEKLGYEANKTLYEADNAVEEEEQQIQLEKEEVDKKVLEEAGAILEATKKNKTLRRFFKKPPKRSH